MEGRRAVGGVHWPELDGLRAAAILLVVARHSLRPFMSEDTYAPVALVGPLDFTPLFLNGWVGVDLFFVLSGFLVGRQAFRGDGWRRFWFKRVTRIVPAYWACLLLVALGLTAAGRWPQSGGHFVAHLLMLQDYTGPVFVPAFWSLGAEEKFYLLAPLLALGVSNLSAGWKQAVGLAALWALPIAARAFEARQLTTPLAYDAYFYMFRSPFHLTCESLVAGFGIAWWSTRPSAVPIGRPAREMAFWGALIVLTALLTGGPLLSAIGWATVVAMPMTLSLCFGAMVWACVSGPGSYSRVLAWPGWSPLAVGSFTLYLTHMMVIPLAMAVAGVSPSSPSDWPRQWLAFVPWYLGLSVLAAWGLHLAVERPVLRWRNRYMSRESAALVPAPLTATRSLEPAS